MVGMGDPPASKVASAPVLTGVRSAVVDTSPDALVTSTAPTPGQSPLDLIGDLVRHGRRDLAAVARREGLGPEDAVDAVQDALCTFLGLAQRGELPDDP